MNDEEAEKGNKIYLKEYAYLLKAIPENLPNGIAFINKEKKPISIEKTKV